MLSHRDIQIEVKRDFTRLGIVQNTERFREYSRYSKVIQLSNPCFMPAYLTDQQAGDLSMIRNNGRFPTVTYVHRWGVNVGKGKGEGCAIWRSAEPIRELAYQRYERDEVMIAALGQVSGKTSG